MADSGQKPWKRRLSETEEGKVATPRAEGSQEPREATEGVGASGGKEDWKRPWFLPPLDVEPYLHPCGCELNPRGWMSHFVRVNPRAKRSKERKMGRPYIFCREHMPPTHVNPCVIGWGPGKAKYEAYKRSMTIGEVAACVAMATEKIPDPLGEYYEEPEEEEVEKEEEENEETGPPNKQPRFEPMEEEEEDLPEREEEESSHDVDDPPMDCGWFPDDHQLFLNMEEEVPNTQTQLPPKEGAQPPQDAPLNPQD